MARVDSMKASKPASTAIFETLKQDNDEKASSPQDKREDVKPIIKPHMRIEPGTVIDLEDCITSTFHDAKEMYRSEINSSELLNIGQSIDIMIANKKQEGDPYEEFESMDMDVSYKYDLDKILRNDHAETGIFVKLADEMTAEETSVESISKLLSAKDDAA